MVSNIPILSSPSSFADSADFSDFNSLYVCPVGCKSAEGKTPSKECPAYDTKHSDGEVPVMLGLWGMRTTCYVLTFWPGQKCHSRWCTGRKWHILMAVMRGNRVGGNWLMKWNELKKIPMIHYRVMHRKRVTSELHDSYFRLRTIKHSISKIEWASSDYIIQLSSTSQSSCQ